MYSNLESLDVTHKLIIGKVNYVLASIGYEVRNNSRDRAVVFGDKVIEPRETGILLYEDIKTYQNEKHTDRLGKYNIIKNFNGIPFLESLLGFETKNIASGNLSINNIKLLNPYNQQNKIIEAVRKRLEQG